MTQAILAINHESRDTAYTGTEQQHARDRHAEEKARAGDGAYIQAQVCSSRTDGVVRPLIEALSVCI